MKTLIARLVALFADARKTKIAASEPARSAVPKPLDLSSVIPSETPYVYIEDDGTARELEPDEVRYLNTEFHGADGARPYIKANYEQLTFDGKMRGYLLRDELPPGSKIKSIEEAVLIETAEKAIEIAKQAIPISFCIKGGTGLVRVIDQRSGKIDFGVPGVDVTSGEFKAALAAGVWRVVRTPGPSAMDIEQACFADVSARSGRVMKYGLLTPRDAAS